jgi:hypothetical protein
VGVAGDLEDQQEVLVEEATRLREVQVDEAPVVRSASCDHHVVDRGRQVPEEALEGRRICGVKGHGAQLTTTVCPRSSGPRGMGEAVVAVLMIPPISSLKLRSP